MMERLKSLLRGDPEQLSACVLRSDRRGLLTYCGFIVIGAGLYGVTVGLWRAPVQSLYTSIKFPLLIFLTCAGNAALNGMLAQLLGSGLSFRQTSFAILMSFALVAMILGGLSPIVFFVLYHAPPLGSKNAIIGHSVMLLTHVFAIAYAGILGNRHLFRLLEKTSGSRGRAYAVLLSWLAGNLFLGSQLAWVLRPFIGSPALPLQFLRDDPLRGNFYESVGRALRHLIF